MTPDTVVAPLLSAVLRQFGEVRVRVTGTSMLPAIRPGDIVRVQHVPLTTIATGDIVLFRWADRLMAHRVVDLQFEEAVPHLITRGDRHAHVDPHVTESGLLGKVVGVVRNRREVSLAAPQPFRPELFGSCLRWTLGTLQPIVRMLAGEAFRA